MKIDNFIEETKKLGVEINESKLQMLEKYYELLYEYNTHTNLTAITEKNDVYLKHFYDSLTMVKAIDLNKINTMIDIGSGAGFPGIIIKIFYPNINMTILDSNGKKTKFIELLVKNLELDKIRVVNARAEDLALNEMNKYDLCVSRAVAYMDIISELSLPFIKKEGKVILMKGQLTNELTILQQHSKDLGIKEYNIIEFHLPITNDVRNLVVLTKQGDTTKLLNYSHILKRNKKWNTKI